jgi:hypothetical protein
MLQGSKVFLYCGPPVFDAAKLMGVDIWEMQELYVDLEEGYLDNYKPGKQGNMEICRHCWANYNCRKTANGVAQVATGGGWQ